MDELIKQVEEDIKEQFEINEKIEFENSKKVLEAFKNHQISEAHLHGTTGYGHDDMGRKVWIGKRIEV